MKCFIILSCLVVCALADYNEQEHIPILKNDRSQGGYGDTSFAFETGNGIYRSEQGSQDDGQQVEGQWSYTAPDGTPIQLSFTAGDDGYQPSGDHLPQPVPLPYNRNDYNDH